MIKAAIVGLGWWGETLLDSVEGSDLLRFVSAFTRSRSPADERVASRHGLVLVDDMAAILTDPSIDAIVLATPPSGHRDQIVAAAQAGKHVFCEKPLAVTLDDARAAVEAARAAGVVLGLGYNRRFHPSWIDLKQRIARGEFGTILHLECTMSGPNGLSAAPAAWRSSPSEAPCGGLFPMGVHAIDGFVDLVGPVAEVFCQSLRRAVPGPNDDTTSVLLRMAGGMSAYLGTMTATAGSFRFHVHGSKAAAYLTGMTHIAGQSSHQRRSGLFGSYVIQPIGGDAVEIDVPECDLNRAELEAFATAAGSGRFYPIPLSEMIHVAAVTDAVVTSARMRRLETVDG